MDGTAEREARAPRYTFGYPFGRGARSRRDARAQSWWVAALLAGGVAMVLGALALYLPPSRATVVLVVGALVFVFVLLHNPAYWRRRLAGTCVGTAAALALTPTAASVAACTA